jgi:sugar/nucleoside kinase (ribokinase family)
MDGGGPAHNVAMDLAKLEVPFAIMGMGAVGDDDAGRYLLKSCNDHGVAAHGIRVISGIQTSQTDVMTVEGTGRRTFFHHQGANANLVPDDFDLSDTSARILHLGAPGIHHNLDQPFGDDASGWVTVLRRAKAQGIKTNLELVSTTPEEIRRLGLPCLDHLDYLIINDYEAAALTGLDILKEGIVSVPIARKAAVQLLAHGVEDLVVIHFPMGCVAAASDGRIVVQPSLNVPQHLIKSTNGAGDAFAAGVLSALHEGWSLEQTLVLGSCAAAATLRSVSTTASVAPAATCLALAQEWGLRTFS